jgi:hypothetical protein
MPGQLRQRGTNIGHGARNRNGTPEDQGDWNGDTQNEKRDETAECA